MAKQEKFRLLDVDCSFDIEDTIFDYYIGWENVKESNVRDYYDKYINYCAKNINVKKITTFNDVTVVVCEISKFVLKHKKQYLQFMRKNVKEQFVPDTSVGIDDEEFYDTYLAVFNDLAIGNYAIEDYEELCSLLGVE